jgi:exonuclease III
VTVSQIDKSLKQKLNRYTVSIKEDLNQMDLSDIYRAFQTKTKEYTFFSGPCGEP